LTAITNLSKDKSVYRGFPPSNRGSYDSSVIVDGNRDGKITATSSNPGDTTNSQVECTACYISTSISANVWIRIDLADRYFVTEVNIFIGELLVNW